MNLRRWAAGGAVALMLLTSGLHRSATADNTTANKPGAAEKADAGKETVYELKEVPIVEEKDLSSLLPAHYVQAPGGSERGVQGRSRASGQSLSKA